MGYMPSSNPPISEASQQALATLGEAIRGRRRQLGLSAAVTAEAAGMSRVTLHRIERGAASTTIGAVMNAAEAVGLHLQFTDTRPRSEENPEMMTAKQAPETVRVGDYPLLRAAAWQLDPDSRLTAYEALRTYERSWRHLDHATMDDEERTFIQALADKYSKGVLLV